MARTKHPALRKVLRTALITLLILTLVGVFYLAVVLGQPQADDDAVKVMQDQPLLAASPALTIQSDDQLSMLVQGFPVPVMRLLSGSGMTLESGVSCDAAFEDGFARVVTLTYSAEWNGQPVTLMVRSIYPARALKLVGREDYHIAGVAGQSLAGLRSVRMENEENIRLHAQASDALYVVTVPKSAAKDLSALTQSLQLFAAKEGV